MSRNIRPAVVAGLDQDWAEACDWFLESTWSKDQLDRFTMLLACETEELRRIATEDELDSIQRLGRIAFYETWRRSFDRVAEDIQNEGTP